MEYIEELTEETKELIEICKRLTVNKNATKYLLTIALDVEKEQAEF